MTALYADHEGDNICWEQLPGWEPWEDDEPDEPDPRESGCAYCGSLEDIREYPDPIGGQRCCEGCFNVIVGGERDDPPWRCGNAPAPQAKVTATPAVGTSDQHRRRPTP